MTLWGSFDSFQEPMRWHAGRDTCGRPPSPTARFSFYFRSSAFWPTPGYEDRSEPREFGKESTLTNAPARDLRDRLAKCSQEHLIAFWSELDDRQQRELAAQLEAVDFELVDRLFREGASHEDWDSLAARAVPPPAFRLDGRGNRFSAEDARERAAAALAAGEVGVLLVAGGQGSRLGFEHPKGLYPIGPVSRHSLFQNHIEKIRAISEHYSVAVPLYLMTSPATHAETIDYLEQNNRFSLPANDLTIFCQGTMPAVDAATGKLLLADRGQLFLSPDGHGGTVSAIHRSGAIDEMHQRGIRQLFYFQVDNPLTPICDETFLGYRLLAESELSTLVVARQTSKDRLGNVVSIDGKLRIIEYIDLPDEAAEARDEDGSFSLWAGSIAVHAIDVAFLDRMAASGESLPFHISEKNVAYVDAEGQQVKPDDAENPNALKFERFIFDLIPSAERAIVVEEERSRVFAPVKNADGEGDETPAATRAALLALHRGWLEAAGATIAEGADVEISPLVARDAEQLAERIETGLHIAETTHFTPGAPGLAGE